jgi:hypothetical protein
MNKRIYFILLPILALLFSFSGRGEDLILCTPASECSIAIASLQNHIPHSFNQTRDDTNQKKNKIRIKAWDDYSAIDVAESWLQFPKKYYYLKPTFSGYTSYFQSAHFSRYNLRGPPAQGCCIL